MTDHLEPYRRMVRSMRFVPPLGRNQLSHSLTEPPAMPLPQPRVSAEETPLSGPAPDPSEHVAALVREAVSTPTVLPVTYAIRENIADTISRLAKPKPVTAVIISPKIPQPDPNWKPREVNSQQTKVESNERVESSQTSPSTSAEVVTVEDQPEISAAEVEAPSAETQVVEQTSEQVSELDSPTSTAEEKAEISAAEVEAPSAEAEAGTVEQASEQVSELDSPTSTAEEKAEIPEAEVEIPSAEAGTVEQTSEQASEIDVPTPTAEAPTAEEKAEIPESEAKAPSAEPQENSQQTTLLETVTHQVGVITDTIKKAAQNLVESVTPGLAESATEESDSAEPVKPSPTDEKQISEGDISQLVCPKCNSTDIKKNGHYKDKQRYACKDCGKYFVLSDTVQEKTDSVTPKDKEVSQQNEEITTKSQKTAKGKAKKKAKGFGR